LIAAIVVGVLLVALVIAFIVIYNRLVRSRVAVDNSWAQIDVQLKRRFDLVPNLVATVQGYAAHERQTLDEVTQARAMAMSAQGPAAQGESQTQLTAALRGLFAVAENYPQLKASANFLALQQQLADTENRIAYARQFYNDAVFALNRRINIFPDNIVAGMAGFHAREFFQAGAAERAPVPVSFGG
jgi:LemA protein